MDFALTPEQEQFGQEFRDYLKTAITPELRAEMEELKEYGGPVSKEFFRKLGADGWLGVGWPKEYGGQGRTPLEQHIFYEVAAAEEAPLPMLALNTVGPTLMRYGSEELKNLVLPRILRGEIEIAIGYSEPNAGTDLASLKSTAVRDGDVFGAELPAVLPVQEGGDLAPELEVAGGGLVQPEQPMTAIGIGHHLFQAAPEHRLGGRDLARVAAAHHDHVRVLDQRRAEVVHQLDDAGLAGELPAEFRKLHTGIIGTARRPGHPAGRNA